MLRALFSRIRITPPAAAFLIGLALLVMVFVWIGLHRATRENAQPAALASETVLGQAIAYPTDAPAKITSVVVTMPPGQETGWHKHDVPMFGYILDGEVTVDYEGAGTRVYRKGDSVLEAIGTPHNGRSTGDVPARILAVFMGEDGIPNTEKVAAPQ